MSAFSRSVMYDIRDNINTLYRRRKQLGQMTLTQQEYVDTFVPSEARHIFREIATYIDTAAQCHSFKLNCGEGKMQTALLYMRGTADKRALPMVRDLAIQPDAPQHVIDRINYWIENGGDPSREFGRVSKVLDLLNNVCSKSALRYYWPTIISLLGERENTRELSKELQELKMPGKIPQLGSSLLTACRITAETIAQAKLIPHDIKAPEPGEVTIEIKVGQLHTEPFGTFYGMS